MVDASDAPPIKLKGKRRETDIFADVLGEIFAFLPLDEVLSNISPVCKAWFDISRSSIHNLSIKTYWNAKKIKRLENFILKRRISFKHISINNDNVTSKQIGFISSFSPDLETLQVEKQVLLDDLKEISHLKTLKSLSLMSIHMDHPKEYFETLASIPNLKMLTLRAYLVKESISTFEKLLNAPNLTYLNISQIKLSELLPVISASKIETLCISKAQMGTKNPFVPLEKCTHLRSLTLESLDLTDNDLDPIWNMIQLESLSLSLLTGITDASLQNISKLTNLKSLEIINLKVFTDISFSKLSSLKNLIYFRCDYSGITDKSLQVLSELKQCKVLKLDGNTQISDLVFDYLPVNLENISINHCSKIKLENSSLQKLINLKKCDFNWNKHMTIVGLKNIESIGLTSLNLGDCVGLKQVMPIVSNLTTVTVLNLSHTPFYDADLRELKRLTSLVRLDLTKTLIKGETFPLLPNLSKLYLNRCPELTSEGMEQICANSGITHLYLMSSYKLKAKIKNFETMVNLISLQIRDCPNLVRDGFFFLGKSHNLRRLILIADNSVDNEVIKVISSLSKLEYLDVSQCDLLDDGCAKYLFKMTGLSRLHMQRCKLKGNAKIKKSLRFTTIKE